MNRRGGRASRGDDEAVESQEQPAGRAAVWPDAAGGCASAQPACPHPAAATRTSCRHPSRLPRRRYLRRPSRASPPPPPRSRAAPPRRPAGVMRRGGVAGRAAESSLCSPECLPPVVQRGRPIRGRQRHAWPRRGSRSVGTNLRRHFVMQMRARESAVDWERPGSCRGPAFPIDGKTDASQRRHRCVGALPSAVVQRAAACRGLHAHVRWVAPASALPPLGHASAVATPPSSSSSRPRSSAHDVCPGGSAASMRCRKSPTSVGDRR